MTEPSARDSLLAATPKRLGDWDLLGFIGRGGQGRVYECKRGEGEPIRAIKVIAGIGAQERSRFQVEVEQHARLAQSGRPGIVDILDHNLGDFTAGADYGFIVMPLAKGALRDALNTTKGRPALCLEALHGVSIGLASAHAEGITHRDLKPANVLYLAEGFRDLRLTDFGICLLRDVDEEDRLTEVGETVGGMHYMAPEQAQGGRVKITHAADVYSAGKLFVYMLTGAHCAREDFDTPIGQAGLAKDPTVKLVRDRILERSIVLEPDRRFQTGSELLAEIDAIVKTTDEVRSGKHP